MLPFFGPLASHRDVPRMCGPSDSEVCPLKTPKAQEVSVSVPWSYRHRHAYASVRPRFPALVPAAQSHFAETRTRRPATPVDHPAPAPSRPAPSLRATRGLNRLRRPKLYRPDTAGRRRDPPLRRSEAGAPRTHAGRPRRKRTASSSITEQHQPWHSSANRLHGRMTSCARTGELSARRTSVPASQRKRARPPCGLRCHAAASG